MANHRHRHRHRHVTRILAFLLHFSLLQALSPPPNPDPAALLSFKSTLLSPTSSLATWTPTTTATFCSTWYGVSCLNNRVTKLVLEDLNLTGPFPTSLLSLTRLRVLSLKHNNLSGPLPTNLSSLSSSLKLLFLSFNSFSGQLPSSLSSLFLLYRLDLSYNNFSGEIPGQLSRLNHLLTLRLEHNSLSGSISGLGNFPTVQDFNISENKLSGRIPTSLSGFPKSAFSTNYALCGPPLLQCKAGETDPTRPGATPSTEGVVSSSPSTALIPTPGKKPSGGKMNIWAIIGIIAGDVAVLAGICLLLYCFFWGRKRREIRAKTRGGAEKVVYSPSSPYRLGSGHGSTGGGGMVFMEGEKRFELEELLRASAEMLGKGVYGTAYKAVLEDGSVVAVKRMKEAVVGSGKKEFEEKMEVLGKLRNVNLVKLRAYYFAKEEKLLVFDFMPNGSLFSLLHGNRGPGRTPLDWTTRLKIASGAARGVAFIHNSSRSPKLVHGNIKSTNVLIDKTGNACVSDFGLSSFAPSSSPAMNHKPNGYCAPESLDGRRFTQKADVYSLGVLLLELLTGKFPSVVEESGPYGPAGVGGVVDLPKWVQSVVREEWTAEVFDLELMRYKDIEEEMVGLLQIAMACTSPSPDQRPKMAQVVKMIDEIRGVEVSPSHSTLDSDSPSVSDDTGGVRQWYVYTNQQPLL